MTPEEVKEIANIVKSVLESEEGTNGPIYVLLSVIVTAAPFVFRYFKKVFVKSIEKVMDTHVKQMDDMFAIMNMHIEELAHVKKEQRENKDSIDQVKEKVDKHQSFIDRLKDKC